MLSKLFGKRARIDAQDPSSRVAAIAELSAEDCAGAQVELAALASSDPELAVRRSAIGRLGLTDQLTVLLDDAHPEIVSSAAKRLLQLAEDAPELLQLPQVRSSAIRDAAEPAKVATLIDAVSEAEELVDLATAARSAKVRLALACRVFDEASLTALEHRSRSRDKTVNRFARTRLDELRHAGSQHAEALHRATQLTSSLAPAADSGPVFSASRIDALASAWATNLEHLDDLTATLSRAEVSVPPHDELARNFAALRQAAEHRTAERARQPEPTASPTGDFPALLGEFNELNGRLRGGPVDWLGEFDSVRSHYGDISARWSTASDQQPPSDELAASHHELTHAFTELFAATERFARRADELKDLRARLPDEMVAKMSSFVAAESSTTDSPPSDYRALWQVQRNAAQVHDRLGSLVQRIGWPGDYPVPAQIDAARAQLEICRSFDEQCQRCARTLEAQARTHLQDLQKYIDDGSLSDALRCDTDLRTTLLDLPVATADGVRRDAHALESRLQELRDWRTFATGPKREALLEDMRVLVDSGLDAVDQADRIKSMRADWNALGPVSNRQDRRIADAFNAAAELAFAPCRAFYEQQAQERASNLQQRENLCDTLAQYLAKIDWTSTARTPDEWKAAEQILHAARDEWRICHPVDRAPGRKLKTRFDGLTDELYAHIKAEWDRNIAQKEELIAQANAATDEDAPVRDAAEAIKKLQQRWRNVGPTPRRVDQRLWKSFRAACDSVFERRDQERDSHRRSLDAEGQVADALCSEFATHIDCCAVDGVSKERLRDFVGRFKQLGDLPRAKSDAIKRRFDELQRTYRSLLDDAVQQALYATLERFENADQSLTLLEQQVAAGESFEPDSIGALEVPTSPELTVRLGNIANAAGADTEHARELRHQMVLEIEIAAGIDSDPADQQRRLEVQVARLNRGMTGTAEVPDPLRLAAQWCGVFGAIDDPEALRTRFFQALLRLTKDQAAPAQHSEQR